MILSFYDQAIDSDIKWWEEIKKLTTEQGDDYTTRYLLDYGYIKKHYRLTAVDLSRQKELDADLKSIQQIEFIGKLKNVDGVNADWGKSMFILIMFIKKQWYENKRNKSMIKDVKLSRSKS